jgi:three-Cys-motif partner protein
MGLEFKGDAICLSGISGTKLKSDIIKNYYTFWWKIASGGDYKQYELQTAIVELDAATGEVYIEDIDKIILGSAGHAVELKNLMHEITSELSLFLVEQDNECFSRLKNVIKRRATNYPKSLVDNKKLQERYKIHLLNCDHKTALKKISRKDLGRSLFFFDPLLFVEWDKIEYVTKHRIDSPFKTGTEFIIFVFTSDWVKGRNDNDPLPKTNNNTLWSKREHKTVKNASKMFGDEKWMDIILNDVPDDVREKRIVDLYKLRLHKWFRFVLPLPFIPKKNQLYHLFFCSNYEDGIDATYHHFANLTGNLKYSPNNSLSFKKFKKRHSMLMCYGNERKPSEWKILWHIIKKCNYGLVDILCRNLPVKNYHLKKNALKFLEKEEYITKIEIDNYPWDEKSEIDRYKINWENVGEYLSIKPPPALNPINAESLLEMRKQGQIINKSTKSKDPQTTIDDFF